MKDKSRYNPYNCYKEWCKDVPNLVRFQFMQNVLDSPFSSVEDKDAARVLIGPAEIAFTLIPFSPKSFAKYLTQASKAAFATPITL